jgi:hypothetical protein
MIWENGWWGGVKWAQLLQQKTKTEINLEVRIGDGGHVDHGDNVLEVALDGETREVKVGVVLKQHVVKRVVAPAEIRGTHGLPQHAQADAGVGVEQRPEQLAPLRLRQHRDVSARVVGPGLAMPGRYCSPSKAVQETH